jgi:hypothetical protein
MLFGTTEGQYGYHKICLGATIPKIKKNRNVKMHEKSCFIVLGCDENTFLNFYEKENFFERCHGSRKISFLFEKLSRKSQSDANAV